MIFRVERGKRVGRELSMRAVDEEEWDKASNGPNSWSGGLKRSKNKESVQS